jgi:hypothetical protein
MTTRAPIRPGNRSQAVLAVRARTSERKAAEFVADALKEIHTFMHDHDLQPTGPPFTIVNRTPRPGTLDIEAGWPIDHPVAGTGRIHGGTLPTMMTGHSSRTRPTDDGAASTDLL